MAGAGMVGVGVGDDGAGDGAQRVDKEVAGLAIEAVFGGFEPGLRVGRHVYLIEQKENIRYNPA
jgi:hypothetical protein